MGCDNTVLSCTPLVGRGRGRVVVLEEVVEVEVIDEVEVVDEVEVEVVEVLDEVVLVLPSLLSSWISTLPRERLYIRNSSSMP